MEDDIKAPVQAKPTIGDPNLEIVTSNFVAEWGGRPYSQLSIVLVHLRFLAMLHQTNHWISKGDPFYGDHLLFERLYGGVTGEIDTVAEKIIGLSTTQNVELNMQLSQLVKVASGFGTAMMIPQASGLAQRSLQAEMNFIRVAEAARNSLKENGLLTTGLDNMLAGILDVHEGHVYLLKQRCSKEMI